MEFNIIETQEKLKAFLPVNRYLHSLGVQYTAANLAMKYEYDIKKAEIAGLLHDCAKCIPDDEMLSECIKNHIPVTPIEEKCKFLLHAKLGAFYAKNEYHISDESIIDAITYHTTGKPEMTTLEKIIYIADYIEPSRKIIPGLSQIRKVAYDDLNQATYLILGHTINYIQKDCQKEMDPMSEQAFEYYKNLNHYKKENVNEYSKNND